MRKIGKKILSTALAGVFTISAVPWNLCLAAEAELPDTMEIGGSVAAVQEIDMPIQFEAATEPAVPATTAAATTTAASTKASASTTKKTASAKVTEDGYKYYITGGFAVIEGYEGDSDVLKIPAKIGDAAVKEIGYGAFSGCNKVTAAVIPDSVERIGHNAFAGCTSLKSIEVPDSVVTLGDETFYGCSGLETVKLPGELVRLEDGLFAGCKALKSIDIPETAERIGKRVFSGCSSLKEPAIPENVYTIGDMAFMGCSAFEKFELPDTVTALGYGVFADCKKLVSVKLPSGITALKSGSDVGMFTRCSALTEVVFPEKLEKIGFATFSKCTSLTEIEIPATVNSIGHDAFAGCTALTALEIPEKVTEVSDNLAKGCKALVSVSIPAGVTSIGNSAFDSCEALAEIKLPDGLLSIGDTAFFGCAAIKEVVVPDKVAEMGYGVFANCLSLRKAVLSDGIKELKSGRNLGVFTGCSALTTVTLPSKLASIGAYSFSECTSLRKITLPTTVTELGNAAFEGDESLLSVTIPDGVKTIGTSAFSGCTSLYEAILPKDFETAGEKAFYGCRSLSNLGSKTGYFRFYKQTFDGCEKLSDKRATVFEPDGISFEANTSNSTVGGAVNFVIRYDLNEWIDEDTKNCTFTLNVPAGLTLVESSVLSDSGNRVTFSRNSNAVSVSETKGVIRFTARIQSYSEDPLNIRPEISFNSHDFNWAQMLPSLSVKVPEVTIGAPQIVGSDTIDVYGIAKPESKVEIFLGEEKAAEAQTSVTGRYRASVKLEDPKAGASYTISAKCGEAVSENVSTLYSVSEPIIDKVEIMYCSHAPAENQAYTDNLDITNTFTEGARPLIYFYPRGGMKFRVTAKNSDRILNMLVTSTKGTETKSLYATYNEEEGVWETPDNSFFDPANHNYVPGSLNVTLVRRTADVVDDTLKTGKYTQELVDRTKVSVSAENDKAAWVSIDIKGVEKMLNPQDEESDKEVSDEEEAEKEEAATLKTPDLHGEVMRYSASAIELDGKTVSASQIAADPKSYGFQKTSKTLVRNGVSYALYSKRPTVVKSADDDKFLKAACAALGKDADNCRKSIAGSERVFTKASVLVPLQSSEVTPDKDGMSAVAKNSVYNKDDGKDDDDDSGSVAVDTFMGDVDSTIKDALAENFLPDELQDLYGKAGVVSGIVDDVTTFNESNKKYEQRMQDAGDSEALQRWAEAGRQIDFLTFLGGKGTGNVPIFNFGYNVAWAETSNALDDLIDIFMKHTRDIEDAWAVAEEAWGGGGGGCGEDYYKHPGSPNTVVDPSGIVYAGNESNPIDGAKMTCYRLNEKTNKWEVWNAEEYDQVNPLYTTAGGKYAWDVPEGNYYVTCEMAGYQTIQSEGFVVSPPKLDLNFNLMSTSQPAVKEAVIKDNVLTVTFTQFVKADTVNAQTLHIEGTKNPYKIEAVMANESDTVTDTFTVTGDFSDAGSLSLTIDSSVTGYNDIALKSYTAQVNNPFIESVPKAPEDLVYTGKTITGVPAGEGYTVTGGEAVNAGEYKAVLKLKEGYKWAGGSEKDVEIKWSIKKADASSVKISQRTSLVYNGKEQAPELTVDKTDVSIVYSTESAGKYGKDVPKFKNAGEYTVYYKAVAENYTDVAGKFTVTISPAALTEVSAAQKDVLYSNGKEQAPEVTTAGKSVDGSTVSFVYSASYSGEYTKALPKFSQPGQYTVYYKASAANHNTVSGSFAVTVSEFKYTVEFNSNDGSDKTAKQQFVYNTAAALDENSFASEGRVFIGWNTEADGSGTSYADGQEVLNLAEKADETVKLYAQWKLRGDISGNGKLDLQDVVIIAKYMVDPTAISEEKLDDADFNGDGVVNLQDAIGIAKKMIGKK